MDKYCQDSRLLLGKQVGLVSKNKINPDNKIIHGLAPKSLTKPQVRFLRIKDLSQIELYQGTQITKPNPRHVHQVLGLSVAIDGMSFHQTKKDTFLVTPGSIVLVNINEMHSGGVPAGKTYTSRAIRIEQSLLSLIEKQLLTNSQSIITLRQPVLQDFELSKQILHLYEVLLTSSSNLEKECLLFDIFANLYRRHGQTDIRHHLAGKEFGPLSRVCDFLNDCFYENISLCKLAEIAGLSPYHLSRVFF